MGMGSRTGRGMGYCFDYERVGFARFGSGFGGGRGWRHWARTTGLPGWLRFDGASPMPVNEASLLKTEAEQLQAQLDAIQKRLTEIEND
jgi:hypothetical protein